MTKPPDIAGNPLENTFTYAQFLEVRAMMEASAEPPPRLEVPVHIDFDTVNIIRIGGVRIQFVRSGARKWDVYSVRTVNGEKVHKAVKKNFASVASSLLDQLTRSLA